MKYAKLDIPEVQDNIPDDLRMGVRSKSESKATPLIRLLRNVSIVKTNTVLCLDLCV